MAGININNNNGAVSDITLENLRVMNNAQYGVYLYNVSGPSGYTGTHCILGNTIDHSEPGSTLIGSPTAAATCP
jgi:hypothetical protein